MSGPFEGYSTGKDLLTRLVENMLNGLGMPSLGTAFLSDIVGDFAADALGRLLGVDMSVPLLNHGAYGLLYGTVQRTVNATTKEYGKEASRRALMEALRPIYATLRPDLGDAARDAKLRGLVNMPGFSMFAPMLLSAIGLDDVAKHNMHINTAIGNQVRFAYRRGRPEDSKNAADIVTSILMDSSGHYNASEFGGLSSGDAAAILAAVSRDVDFGAGGGENSTKIERGKKQVQNIAKSLGALRGLTKTMAEAIAEIEQLSGSRISSMTADQISAYTRTLADQKLGASYSKKELFQMTAMLNQQYANNPFASPADIANAAHLAGMILGASIVMPGQSVAQAQAASQQLIADTAASGGSDLLARHVAVLAARARAALKAGMPEAEVIAKFGGLDAESIARRTRMDANVQGVSAAQLIADRSRALGITREDLSTAESSPEWEAAKRHSVQLGLQARTRQDAAIGVRIMKHYAKGRFNEADLVALQRMFVEGIAQGRINLADEDTWTDENGNPLSEAQKDVLRGLRFNTRGQVHLQNQVIARKQQIEADLSAGREAKQKVINDILDKGFTYKIIHDGGFSFADIQERFKANRAALEAAGIDWRHAAEDVYGAYDAAAWATGALKGQNKSEAFASAAGKGLMNWLMDKENASKAAVRKQLEIVSSDEYDDYAKQRAGMLLLVYQKYGVEQAEAYINGTKEEEERKERKKKLIASVESGKDMGKEMADAAFNDAYRDLEKNNITKAAEAFGAITNGQVDRKKLAEFMKIKQQEYEKMGEEAQKQFNEFQSFAQEHLGESYNKGAGDGKESMDSILIMLKDLLEKLLNWLGKQENTPDSGSGEPTQA